MYTIKHKPIEDYKLIDIKFEDVDQLYIGKGNSCRCGCKGEYYSPSEAPKTIKQTLERMSNGTYIVTSIENYIFEIQVNEERDIVHTLYLKK